MLSFTPISDMFETRESIIIQVELSGVKKEDINIELKGNSIEISGIKRHDGLTGDENYQRMERPFGIFKRIFNLPAYIEKNSIEASFNEGILEITILKNPGAEKNKTMCINVKSLQD